LVTVSRHPTSGTPEIFFRETVVGIALLLGWLSWETRRRSQVELKRQAKAAAVQQIPIDTVKAPVRRPRRRKRLTR
jgi:hypothetical protein